MTDWYSEGPSLSPRAMQQLELGSYSDRHVIFHTVDQNSDLPATLKFKCFAVSFICSVVLPKTHRGRLAPRWRSSQTPSLANFATSL